MLEIDGEKVSGYFSKTATVHTNDQRSPQLTVTIAGTIIPYVDVQPGTRIYLRGMYGETVSQDLTVTSNEQKSDFKVWAVTSNIDDNITYKIVPENEPGKYTIKLWKNPKLPTLNTWGSLTIKTNSEVSPEKIVQVNVTTRGAIVVQPSTVNFGSVKNVPDSPVGGPGDVERQVTVYKLKGDFTIDDIKFSSGFYQADIKEIEEHKRFLVTVKFHPGATKKSYIDEMIIMTSDPQEPALRIRLVARGLNQ